MKVVIDGIEYVKAKPAPGNQSELQRALELRFDSPAGDDLSIREYLHKLLRKFAIEGEGFNSKRPFGFSFWQFDLYPPLIDNGFLSGRVDEDGYEEDISHPEGDALILELIDAMCIDKP